MYNRSIPSYRKLHFLRRAITAGTDSARTWQKARAFFLPLLLMDSSCEKEFRILVFPKSRLRARPSVQRPMALESIKNDEFEETKNFIKWRHQISRFRFTEKGGSTQKMRYILSKSSRRKLHVLRGAIAKGIDSARPRQKARVFFQTPFFGGSQFRKEISNISFFRICVCAFVRPPRSPERYNR